MIDATQSPMQPLAPEQPPQGAAAPDPADFGTAYGMEMSIDTAAKPSNVDIDLNDPLSWIRRWVDRQKPA
jgi:hypothetical protein